MTTLMEEEVPWETVQTNLPGHDIHWEDRRNHFHGEVASIKFADGTLGTRVVVIDMASTFVESLDGSDVEIAPCPFTGLNENQPTINETGLLRVPIPLFGALYQQL